MGSVESELQGILLVDSYLSSNVAINSKQCGNLTSTVLYEYMGVFRLIL